MPYGDLAAVPGENIEPVNTDNGNTDHGQYGQHPITEKQRAGEKEDEEGEQHSPMQPGADNSHVLRVAFSKGSRM